MTSGSKFGFFNIGFTMATFSAGGKMPDFNDEFMMERMSVDTESQSKTDLKNFVGMGSRAQVDGLSFETALQSVSMSTGANWFMVAFSAG